MAEVMDKVREYLHQFAVLPHVRLVFHGAQLCSDALADLRQKRYFIDLGDSTIGRGIFKSRSSPPEPGYLPVLYDWVIP